MTSICLYTCVSLYTPFYKQLTCSRGAVLLSTDRDPTRTVCWETLSCGVSVFSCFYENVRSFPINKTSKSPLPIDRPDNSH